jgi:hypothetical protein
VLLWFHQLINLPLLLLLLLLPHPQAWECGVASDTDPEWRVRADQLRAYHRQHGDTSVGHRDGDDPDLARCALTQIVYFFEFGSSEHAHTGHMGWVDFSRAVLQLRPFNLVRSLCAWLYSMHNDVPVTLTVLLMLYCVLAGG